MAAQNTTPEKLGPYRLLEKIGEGGMGVVHLARDPQGRAVAIKVLRPGVAGDPDARRRLNREFETMRRVRSPFVAAVVDADVTGPVPYVVTRYVAGPSLDQMVAATGPVRGQALERLAWGLAEGLAAVHAAGVVHRDLKPGNVVIQGGVPVLIDFGIAHGPDATKITQTGMFMGTPGYLAPEVVEGSPSTPAADIHSWASTVAFAATGRPPFGSGSYETIFYRIISGHPDLAGIPARLLPVVTAALARDPLSRPSAVQLSKECAAIDLSGPDTAADGMAVPGQARALGTLAAPRVMGAGAAGAAAAVGAAAMGGHGTMLDRADLDRSDAEVRRWAQQMRQVQARNGRGNYADVLPPASYAPGVRPAAGRPWTSAAAAHPTFARWLTLLAVAIAIVLSVLLPVAGPLISLLLIIGLRTADLAHAGLTRRRTLQGARPSDVPVMILKTPWAALRALLGTLLLAPLALCCGAIAAAATIMAVHTNPLPDAGAYAAGAFVACYWYGPASQPPRRQLGRFFAVFTRSRITMVLAPVVLILLLAAAVGAAGTQAHDLWPLSRSIALHLNSIYHFVQRLQSRLPHI